MCVRACVCFCVCAFAYCVLQVVAFASKNPRARVHLLVVPKLHIPTIAHVAAHELPLLLHMQRVGEHILSMHSEQTPRNHGSGQTRGGGHQACSHARSRECVGLEANHVARLGFHRPPFHSVDHLHMHCIEPPFTQTLASWRYSPCSFWFVSVQRVIAGLQDSNIPRDL